MARAAVLPPSPVKRGARTAPRSTLTKSGKTAAKKSANKAAPAAGKVAISDMDDTDDELGMMMEEVPAPKSAKPRGRPPARPTAKNTTSRGKKAASAATPAPALEESDRETEEQAKPEPPKKRVGRPRKNPVPEEVATKTEAAPKPRGRPKGSGTKSGSTTTATRRGTRTKAEVEAATDNDEPKHFMIATNSTTMRSNILRGPAKKKTVTFQDVSESEPEDAEEPVATAPARRKTPARNTKSGLGATPVRKAPATGARGRKAAAAKKATAQPLSPKKDKQMAKSLSAYAGSDGEEDELSAAKDDSKSPVKLVVHSPAKHTAEHMGLSSPVRKINFTPKKASSLIDENGEPKLPTPKHGSAAAGLSSPVRKINFTPNRSHHSAVADNGHLALPPGKSIDFSDSVFMSSPPRRPEASPFQFTLRGTPHKGLAKSIPAPNFTPGEISPLKASPKKGHLGASFSGSPSKSTPALPARTSLFQSPAKRPASPFKGSLFSSKMGNEWTPLQHGGAIAGQSRSSPPKASQTPAKESAVDEDIEMVEEVARDIFGIEISSSNSKALSESPLSTEVLEPQTMAGADIADTEQVGHTAIESHDSGNNESDDTDEKLQELEEEVRREPDDMGTICFSTMEELQEPFQNLERQNGVDDVQVAEFDFANEVADERTPEPETILDCAELVDTDQDHPSPSPSPPSEPTLGLNALEEALSPASVRESNEDVQDDQWHPYDEKEVGSEQDEGDNDEPTLVPSEATITMSSQPRSPYGVREAGGSSPMRLSSVPPLAPTPPVRETTPVDDVPSKPTGGSRTGSPSRVKSIDRLFDINYEPRAEVEEDSYFETTQSEIPTPTAPRGSETPRARSQHKSLGVDLGFTPLAQQFGGWEATTPSQATRPRRRGVFSLVGPLEKPTESITHDAGDVSYPDLSRASLADTPRLFAELPHDSMSDCASMASHASALQSPMTTQDELMESPAKSEIFEDPEPTVASDKSPLHEVSTPDMAHDEEQDSSDDDKENSDTHSFVPPTTPVRLVSEQRTIHTVSKVPLKAEGEVSPLKLPRKRNLSLSAASPTRFSPRTRRSSRAGSPTSSPHKVSRMERSPSPKRRCSTPRCSNGKLPAVAPPKSSSAASSPSKTPRRPSQQALRGAVVHVDVHTTEGEDASGIFVELLQQMGARCVKSWSWNPRSSASPVDGQDPKDTNAKVGITHVVYKDGGLRTLEKVKHAAGLVKCVGVGWVLE